jgi:hypothetical protein
MIICNYPKDLEVWKRIRKRQTMFDSKGTFMPAAFNNWWRQHRRFEIMISTLLDDLNPDLAVTNDVEFGPEFEYVISRALGSLSRWKEKRCEERVNRQYHTFKANNPGAKVNRDTRDI